MQVSDIEGRKAAVRQQHHVSSHRHATDLFAFDALELRAFVLGRLADGSVRHETLGLPFIVSSGVSTSPTARNVLSTLYLARVPDYLRLISLVRHGFQVPTELLLLL